MIFTSFCQYLYLIFHETASSEDVKNSYKFFFHSFSKLFSATSTVEALKISIQKRKQ